ncbi:MAG: ABC transporter permease [Spirochaetaceae bacterium]
MDAKRANNLTLATIFVIVTAIMAISLPDRFMTLINWRSMALQFPEYGLLAFGIMLAMLTGGIDLSLVSIVSLSGVLSGMFLSRHAELGLPPGITILIAIVIALVTAALCGLLNGVLIAFANVPAIIATLGTNGLFLGIAIVLTRGHGIQGFPSQFIMIANGMTLGIPNNFIIFVVIALLIGLLLSRSRLGFQMRLLGASPEAAQYSGINNRSVLIKTHILAALLAGVAAIIIISKVNSIRPGYGSGYLLLSVLIAILGGTNPAGGFATTLGVTLGIFTMQVLTSGLNIIGFLPFFRRFIYGVFLLAVMVIHHYRKQSGEFRLPIPKMKKS